MDHGKAAHHILGFKLLDVAPSAISILKGKMRISVISVIVLRIAPGDAFLEKGALSSGNFSFSGACTKLCLFAGSIMDIIHVCKATPQ